MNSDILKYFATSKGIDAAWVNFFAAGWYFGAFEKQLIISIGCFLLGFFLVVVCVVYKHDTNKQIENKKIDNTQE